MKIKLFINFLKKKNFFFIILLLITVYSLYDRAIWSNISVWQADEATSMWLGLTKSISNMPVGLISSEGFPNPNGMIIFAKAFSYLPSLWSVSFVLSFIQFFLILILGYILFKNDNRFYLFILPIVFCVALRSTSVQFANQYVLTSVNLLYFILLIIYLKKPSPLKFIFLLMPIIIGPAIYLAGLANSFAFLICSLFALFLYPPEKKLINLIMASVVGLILITLSIIFTWEPYFNTLTLNLTPTNKLDKLFISLFTIVKFPYWSVVYGAGEIVGSFKQNGFDSKVYPYWSLFHMNDEGWKWYLKYGGHLTNQSVLALRISSIFIIAQSILSCLVLIIAPLIHLIKYGSLQNVLISNKKKENQFLLLIILFIISLLFFGTLLGSTGWIDGKRLDQQVQFLPLLILIWFMVPNVFNISKFLNKIVYRCSLFFCFFYILLNIIGGHLITRDYLEYTGEKRLERRCHRSVGSW